MLRGLEVAAGVAPGGGNRLQVIDMAGAIFVPLTIGAVAIHALLRKVQKK